MSLYSTFCRHMQGLTAQHTLLVAFSGGLDSTVLLALAARFAKERGIAIRALHIAHGLQDAAKAWPQHCKNVAALLDVECVMKEVHITLGPRISLEAAARDARYQALEQLMSEHDILLTGHHLDDQAETLLLALKRGAGIAGLAAMPERKPFGSQSQYQHWRPLLGCSRQSLEIYAKEQGLNWVEDPSNRNDEFDRNFLRNQILPRLLKQWPSFNHTVARSAELCGEQLQLAQELAELDFPSVKNNSGGLKIAGLQALSVARRHNVLRHWLQLHNVYPSRTQLDAIWQQVALARRDATPQVRLGAASILRYQGALYIPNATGKTQVLQELIPERWLDAGVGRLRLSWVEQGADLDGELSLSQLQLSFNIHGLRAQPQGRASSRALKKLWQEYAVPTWLRAHMPLLLIGNEQLVAVPGLFVSQDYAAKPNQAGWRLEWRAADTEANLV
ncbi:tRNA lysidine(34) synthetase TilS [Oceanisphaera avium]|uniref:tRNA(Ile)-lysidine synthase n=1 Tax=Oceanisphaera avium TaxID=1903694 RepID=A0A1Y0CVE7_9GAMM|nr:tRNA lysidine(34) synthetase TilS [Oceanisphaera avium]ART78855.1 tRNA lysidine(34) synthetase TilS [Oceanisphaera avium]